MRLKPKYDSNNSTIIISCSNNEQLIVTEKILKAFSYSYEKYSLGNDKCTFTLKSKSKDDYKIFLNLSKSNIWIEFNDL